jgi:hypothetical protein
MPNLAERLAAPALDALTLLAAWWALPALAAQLGRESEVNLALLLGAYMLMCLGLAAGQHLKPADPARQAGLASQGCLLGLSLPFSLGLMAMLVVAGGLLNDTTPAGAFVTQAAGDGGPGLTLLATFAFLLLLAAFPGAVLYNPRSHLAPGGPAYWAVRLGSLLAVNAMVLVTAGFWQGYLSGSEPLEAGLGARIMLTLVLYPVFLLFFAPPRLALLSLEPGRWSLAGFYVTLAVYVWRLTA